MRTRALKYMKRRWTLRKEQAQQDREYIKDFFLCLSFSELCQINTAHFSRMTSVNTSIVADVFDELTSGFSNSYPSIYDVIAAN